MSQCIFPKNFVFGAAASAFQIEGAVIEDGRGPTIWDVFSHKEGKTLKNAHADVACDHYHKYKEDVALMKQLNLQAYRGSIAWSRIYPEGKGRVNQKGLDFYKRLTDELLKKDITPYYTLFHWDLPLALQKEFGGFQSRKIVDAFGDYVDTVVGALGDRVSNWMTVNEPFEYAGMGHLLGNFAPGKKNPWLYFRAMHNYLLSHGEAVQRIRSRYPESNIGLAVSLTPIHPAKDDPKTIKAAKLANQFLNDITLSPLFKAEYPRELYKKVRMFMPKIYPGDMEKITTPIDFFGINNYQREFATYNRFFPLLHFDVSGVGERREDLYVDGAEYTHIGWEVYPKSIRESIEMVQGYTDTPIYITENGAAFKDELTERGVYDDRRINFIKECLKEINTAMQNGAPVKGYFVWSVMDVFEWSGGYKPTFGLIYHDRKNNKRTIKDSGYWYAKVIDNRGFSL